MFRPCFGVQVAYLQSNVSGDGLLAWHDAKTAGAAQTLSKELEQIQRTIDEREKSRPWPYRVGRPRHVSNSINA